MPFTPLHVGPGVLLKALLQGRFSLMIFAWAQLLMDIQPLVAVLSGVYWWPELHSWFHSLFGASLLTLFCMVSGKYLLQWLLLLQSGSPVTIAWRLALLSAALGCYSHVLLDSMMHSDLLPLQPFSQHNPWLAMLDVPSLHKLCLYSGLIGAGLYFLLSYRQKKSV